MWTLDNPSAFPNLCKCHPNYLALQAAWTASGGTDKKKEESVTAADIQLDSALVEIEESDLEPDDY